MICIAIFVFVVILGFDSDLLVHKLSICFKWWNRFNTTLGSLVIYLIYFFLGSLLNCKLVGLCEQQCCLSDLQCCSSSSVGPLSRSAAQVFNGAFEFLF